MSCSAHLSDTGEASAGEDARLDKWLWMVRVFKTRALAAEACRAVRVKVNGGDAKASHSVRSGQIIEVRTGPLTRKLVALGVPPGRQGAAKLEMFIRDETAPEVYAQAAEQRAQQRLAGAAGKPASKRERRERRELFGDA